MALSTIKYSLTVTNQIEMLHWRRHEKYKVRGWSHGPTFGYWNVLNRYV